MRAHSQDDDSCICDECGSDVGEDAEYCPFCGTEFADDEDADE
jgi:predicted amidophosphoribosyltransferase